MYTWRFSSLIDPFSNMLDIWTVWMRTSSLPQLKKFCEKEDCHSFSHTATMCLTPETLQAEICQITKTNASSLFTLWSWSLNWAKTMMFGIGGSIFTFVWIACPEWTASYSFPDANMCILSLVLDRKPSEVSKTVWMISVSITELIWQAKTWEKSKQEVGNLRFVVFELIPIEYTVGYGLFCTS